jgi:hypothetical protein
MSNIVAVNRSNIVAMCNVFPYMKEKKTTLIVKIPYVSKNWHDASTRISKILIFLILNIN